MEECKYVIRKNKMENLINDDLDLSSSDESDENDNEIDSDDSTCFFCFFFDILLVFFSFLQTCYDICFFHILFLYFFLL